MRTVTQLPYSTMSIKISSKFLLGSCIGLLLTLPCQGWIPQASGSRYTHNSATSSTTTTTSPTIGIGMNSDIMRLGASSSSLPNEYDGDSIDDTDTDNTLPSKPRIYRAAFSGVAVSPMGFWVMLKVAPDQYWPVQVTAIASTAVIADRPAAQVTSPEALTLLQLLAGVDMAGAILPPDILARIIIGVCDNDLHNDAYADNSNNSNNVIRALVRRSSNWQQAPVNTAYLDLPDWWQSRIRLPICTLDEIRYQETVGTSTSSAGGGGGEGTWEYQCQVQDAGPHTVTPTCNVLQKVAWSDPATATDEDEETKDVPCSEQAAFFALALALRYNAPIRLSLASDSDSLLLSHAQVLAQFPLYRSRDKLQETPATVTANIERGFEIHKLQRALQIAIQKQDMVAAAKIRSVLDEMDSLQDLPVQAETDTQNMQ